MTKTMPVLLQVKSFQDIQIKDICGEAGFLMAIFIIIFKTKINS